MRGVIETAMLDVMFDIPSKTNVKEVIIDEKVILEKAAPKLVYKTEEEIKEAKNKESDPAESA